MRKRAKACRTLMLVLLAMIAAGECGSDKARAQTNRQTPAGARAEMRWRAARVEPHIRAAARRHGVDPRALWTIAYLETRFQPELVSPKGARGMMQFMPGTAARYGLQDPHDEIAAIHAAARYVRDLSLRFGNRLDLVLAGYNAGEGAVEAFLRGVSVRLPDGRVINPRRLRTGGVPPYAETRNYVSRGLYVARQVAASGIFSTPSDLMAGGAALKTPSSASPAANVATIDASGGEGVASLSEVAAPPPPEVVVAAPVSSYAIVASTSTAKNRAAVQLSPASSTGARSVRAPVTGMNNASSIRVYSSRVAGGSDVQSVSAEPSEAAPPPRSTRVLLAAPQP